MDRGGSNVKGKASEMENQRGDKAGRKKKSKGLGRG